MDEPDPAADAVRAAYLGRVEAEAARLVASPWSAAELATLEAAFERAAVQALRAPALAERSVRLRAIAKRVVPAPLVAPLKRVVRLLDAGSRALSRRLDRVAGR